MNVFKGCLNNPGLKWWKSLNLDESTSHVQSALDKFKPKDEATLQQQHN